MRSALFHRIAAGAALGGYRRFRRALADPEVAQRRALARILGSLSGTERLRRAGLDGRSSYDDFARALPVTHYAALEPLIAEQRLRPHRAVLAREPVHFVPTSGSTAACKWIPATPASGREFDAAAAAWFLDLSLRHPTLLDGRHYWSLSWLPDSLRGQGVDNDDLKRLSPSRRWILEKSMAVPGEIPSLATAAASRRATLVHLAACRDLRMVSVWSPTFFLALLDELDRTRDSLAAILERGEWQAGWSSELGPPPRGRAPRSRRAARVLRATAVAEGPDTPEALWPRLALVSAWDSATSAGFARDLRRRLPRARFQGKGLWATEGVVTIPFGGDYPIALTSHFLEFRCLDTGRILPAWELRESQELQPLLTTGAGLLRYALDDRVRVTGAMGRTPCLHFVGRLGGQDLVGEKLTVALAQAALADLERQLPLRALCLCAVVPPDAPPFYAVLAEAADGAVHADRVAHAIESRLRRIHHYALARDAKQLDGARAVVRSDARSIYQQLKGGAGRVEGAQKIEAIVTLDSPGATEFLFGPELVGGERRCVWS